MSKKVFSLGRDHADILQKPNAKGRDRVRNLPALAFMRRLCFQVSVSKPLKFHKQQCHHY